jgi:Flp pilus assembly protein TadD/energy-coupling factor transporter ATP-binding protein EcfA2
MDNEEIARLREALRREPVNPERRANLGELLFNEGQYAEAEALFMDCCRLEPDNPAHHERLGRALSALGRLAEAETAFGLAAQHQPDNPFFHAELGWTQIRQDKYVEAETAFQEAVKLESKNAAYQAGLGQALAGQGKYAEAEVALLLATQFDKDNPDYLDALGEAVAFQGRHAEAESFFRKATELDATALPYRLHLGQALLNEGRYDRAEAEFQTAIGLDPDSATAHAGLGHAWVGQGRNDEAEAEFQTAIGLDPDSATAHAGLGHAWVGQGQHARAEAAFQRALQAGSRDPRFHLDLGRSRAAQARYAEAAEEFRQALREDPGNPQLHADLGRALLSQNLAGQAEQELRKAIQLDPENPSYKADLGEALLSRNRFTEAETFFRQARQRDETNPTYVAGLVRALSGKGDFASADKLLGQLAYDANSAKYRAASGSALSASGRHPEAQRLFKEAIRLDPDNAEYRALLGRSLLVAGQYDAAQKLFTEATDLAPGHPAYKADLANALFAQGKLSEAEEALIQAALLEPGNAFYWAELSRILEGQNRDEEATSALRQALRHDPGNPQYHADLGRLLLRQGRNADAEEGFREALRLDPGNPSYLTGLGQALAVQEKHAEAEAAFREAMESDPHSPACISGLADALTAQENHAEAEDIFRNALERDPGDLELQAKFGLVLAHKGELSQAVDILKELQRDPNALDTSVADLQKAVHAAYDHAIVDYACDLADQLSDKRDLQRRGIAWHEYRDYVAKISESEAAKIRPAFRDWSEAETGEETESEAAHPTRRSNRVRLIGSLCLLAAALATGGTLLTGSAPALGQEARHLTEGLSLTVATLGVLLPVIYFLRSRRVKPQPIRLSSPLESQLASLISNLVLKPAAAAALQVNWKDSAVDRVSIRDGEELSAKAELADLISTKANKDLARALCRRNGAAVALAGPRGSGKTELARIFTELSPPTPSNPMIPLMLWAPAKYDAHSFLLRVLKELCIAIISMNSSNSENDVHSFISARQHQALYQLVVAGALIALGVTVLVARVAEIKISTIIPFLVACILITGGITMLVAIGKPHRRRAYSEGLIKQTTIERVRELLTRVEFVDTYTRNASLAFSGYGLNASATQGSQFSRLPLSDLDIVRELRETVKSIAKEGWKVVIAIDELDKMHDTEEVVAFLNHIKVLFPIYGCSFIVSISEDGWARFESRGLPHRDTFDSTFEEVIKIEMLTHNESRDFLKMRNGSITDTQALLCHCLSGGLPRDLLRAARQLARVANWARGTIGSDPLLCDVMTPLLNEKLKDKLDASEMSARKRRAEAAMFTTSWLKTWSDEEETERTLARIYAARGLEIPSGLPHEASREQESAALDKNYIETYIAVLHTIRQAFRPGGPIAELGYRQADDEYIKGFDLIASSLWKLERDIGGAWELLHEARRTLGMTPLNGTESE